MYAIEYKKFNHLDNGCKIVEGGKFDTKSAAIAHLEDNGFVQIGLLDPSFKTYKLPSVFCNDAMRCNAYIKRI